MSPYREFATLDRESPDRNVARAVQLGPRMKKVDIVQAYGKRIVQIDFDGCGPDQYEAVLAEAERIILREQASTALTLVGDTHFDTEAVEQLTRFATRVTPLLERSAVVGLTGVKKVIFGGIKEHYRAPVGVFDDPEQAKAWLAQH
jgi:hypothetical protein